MTVSPRDVFALGCARPVEQSRLREQDKRPRRMLAGGDLRLGFGDLLQRAAEVNGCGPQAVSRSPRDRSIERPVHLVRAGAMVKVSVLFSVTAFLVMMRQLAHGRG